MASGCLLSRLGSKTFADVDLGDARRTRRLIAPAARIAAHPEKPFTQVFDRGPLKGFYRPRRVSAAPDRRLCRGRGRRHAPRPRPGLHGDPADRKVGDGHRVHPTGEGWAYLAAVEDRYSWAIIGGAVSGTPGIWPGPAGLGRRGDPPAAGTGPDRTLGPGVPVHESRVPPGVGRPAGGRQFQPEGNGWDNAPDGELRRQPEKELVHREWFPIRADAERAVFESVEALCNRVRRHSAWGMSSRQRSKPNNRDTLSTNRGELHTLTIARYGIFGVSGVFPSSASGYWPSCRSMLAISFPIIAVSSAGFVFARSVDSKGSSARLNNW